MAESSARSEGSRTGAARDNSSVDGGGRSIDTHTAAPGQPQRARALAPDWHTSLAGAAQAGQRPAAEREQGREQQVQRKLENEQEQPEDEFFEVEEVSINANTGAGWSRILKGNLISC